MGKKFFAPILIILVSALAAGCIAPVVVPQPPPSAMVEVRPAVPYPDAVWIDGYWTHRRGNWVWSPGFWDRRPWPGATWAPGHWRESPRGWHWNPGHWRR